MRPFVQCGTPALARGSRAADGGGMEIGTSSAPSLLLQADRLATARDVVETAQQATPAQTPAVVIELSAAATALAAGSGGSPEAA